MAYSNQHVISRIDEDGDYRLDDDEGFFFAENELELIKDGDMEFKAGDYFRIKKEKEDCGWYTDKVFQAESVNVERKTITANLVYNWSDVELVCNFTKGQRIYVSNYYKDYTDKDEVEFINYDASLDRPYVCKVVSAFNISYINSFQYAKSIEELDYKPYSEPKPKWIGERVKDKSGGKMLIIENITRFKLTNELVLALRQDFSDNLFYFTMQEFYDRFTWKDGSVCGEINRSK